MNEHEMKDECVRLFNEMAKLLAQQGQILINQGEMITELKTLVANHFVQLSADVKGLQKDIAPLSWIKWVTLVIGAILIAQAIAQIFE